MTESDLDHPQALESSCQGDDLLASLVVTVWAHATRLVKQEHRRCRWPTYWNADEELSCVANDTVVDG